MIGPVEPGRSIHASGSRTLSEAAISALWPNPLKFGSARSLPNPHGFAGPCARRRLRCPGLSAGRGALKAVAVDVAGQVADRAGVVHAEGGGGQLGVEVVDELSDSGQPALGRRGTCRLCPDGTPVTAGLVIGAYHQLFEIERPFRMAKSDLQARPVYHYLRDSIEAHPTIVFAALAVSRWIEHQTGRSIRRFVRTARRYRTIQIQARSQTITAADPLPDNLRQALDQINAPARTHG